MRRWSRGGLPIGSQLRGQSSRRLGRWTSETAQRGFDGPQGDERLGLLHRGRDWIDDRYADQISSARRKTGQGSTGEDCNISITLRNRIVGKVHKRRPVGFAGVPERTETAIETDDARTTAFEAVHDDAVAIPPAQRARKSDDEKLPAEHAGRKHRRLRDADHRKIEQFAGAEQAWITKSRKDRRVKLAPGLGKHFKCDGPTNLGLGAARDIWETSRRRDGLDFDTRRSHCAPGVEH